MIPLRFTYYSKKADQKVYVTILQQFTHHFTGEVMYKVREEFARGWALERIYNQASILRLLANTVEEKCCDIHMYVERERKDADA